MSKLFKGVSDKAPRGNSVPPINGIVEINLLPDIKRELVRTQIMQSRVITVSILVSLSAAAVVVILALTAFLGQGVKLLSLDNNIKDEFTKYEQYPGVDQIITIQNQLANIDATHRDKPITSRLMTVVVSMVKGSNDSVKLSKISFDQSSQTITLEGQSKDTYVGLERFKKAILATTFEHVSQNQNEDEDDAPHEPDFVTNEVLEMETPGLTDDPSGDKVLVFKISFVVHNDLFTNSYNEVVVKGPGRQDVTDSRIVIPRDVFAPKPSNDKKGRLGDNGSGEEEQ